MKTARTILTVLGLELLVIVSLLFSDFLFGVSGGSLAAWGLTIVLLLVNLCLLGLLAQERGYGITGLFVAIVFIIVNLYALSFVFFSTRSWVLDGSMILLEIVTILILVAHIYLMERRVFFPSLKRPPLNSIPENSRIFHREFLADDVPSLRKEYNAAKV